MRATNWKKWTGRNGAYDDKENEKEKHKNFMVTRVEALWVIFGEWLLCNCFIFGRAGKNRREEEGGGRWGMGLDWIGKRRIYSHCPHTARMYYHPPPPNPNSPDNHLPCAAGNGHPLPSHLAAQDSTRMSACVTQNNAAAVLKGLEALEFAFNPFGF
ncbi:hypothetical protein Tsubulata_046891 [Turnera subulata]|uniref:Uncharacterized protein n=1 Tax=Turnera subulata TaxID=218843 RepID=A0A9Q0JG53_9ROSI|nr:hypothetical protein Tsubulata_046891 [Turnera subulata]